MFTSRQDPADPLLVLHFLVPRDMGGARPNVLWGRIVMVAMVVPKAALGKSVVKDRHLDGGG